GRKATTAHRRKDGPFACRYFWAKVAAECPGLFPFQRFQLKASPDTEHRSHLFGSGVLLISISCCSKGVNHVSSETSQAAGQGLGRSAGERCRRRHPAEPAVAGPPAGRGGLGAHPLP